MIDLEASSKHPKQRVNDDTYAHMLYVYYYRRSQGGKDILGVRRVTKKHASTRTTSGCNSVARERTRQLFFEIKNELLEIDYGWFISV